MTREPFEIGAARRAASPRSGRARSPSGAVALVFLFALPLRAARRRVHAGLRRRARTPISRAGTEPEAWNAIRLTLVTAAFVVPLNLVFGVAAAWALARFEFRGRSS